MGQTEQLSVGFRFKGLGDSKYQIEPFLKRLIIADKKYIADNSNVRKAKKSATCSKALADAKMNDIMYLLELLSKCVL